MTINECYEILGEVVFQGVDNTWTKAVLKIRKLEISTAFQGTYWNQQGEEKSMSLKIGLPTYDAVDFIHEITTKDNKNKWNRAEFYVTREGKFDMKFIWDQELHDEIERLNNE